MENGVSVRATRGGASLVQETRSLADNLVPSGGVLNEGLSLLADFGLAIADTMSEREQERAKQQAERAARERKDAQDTLDAAFAQTAAQELEISLQAELDEIQRNGNPADPANADKMLSIGRNQIAAIAQGAEGISGDAIRRFQGKATTTILERYRSALKDARTAGAAQTTDALNRTINRYANEVEREPGLLSGRLDALKERLADFSHLADANTERDLLTAGQAALGKAAVRGLIRKGRFDEATERLDGGAFDEVFTPETTQQLRKDIASARKQHGDTMKSLHQGRMDAAIARAEETGSYDPSIFDRAEAVVGTEAAAAAEEKAMRGQIVFNRVRELKELPPTAATRAYMAMRPDETNPIYDQRDTFGADLETWRKIGRQLSDYHKQLRNDPKAAVAEDVERQIDILRDRGEIAGEEDEAATRAHLSIQAQRFAGKRRYSILTNIEAADQVAAFDAATPAGKLDMVTNWRENFGQHLESGLRDLERAGLPSGFSVAAAYAEPGFKSVAQDIVNGLTNENAKDIIPSAPEFALILEDTLTPLLSLSPTGLKAAKDAARAIYITRAQRAGLSGTDFDGARETLLETAIEDAVGGFVEVAGTRTIAPLPFLPQQEFDTAFAELTQKDIRRAEFIDGSKVPVEHIKDGTIEMVPVAEGMYLLRHKGALIADRRDATGFFVLDLKEIWPDLVARAAEREDTSSVPPATAVNPRAAPKPNSRFEGGTQ